MIFDFRLSDFSAISVSAPFNAFASGSPTQADMRGSRIIVEARMRAH